MNLQTRLSRLEQLAAPAVCECQNEFADLSDEELNQRVLAHCKNLTGEQIIETFRSVGVEFKRSDTGEIEIEYTEKALEIISRKCPIHHQKN